MKHLSKNSFFKISLILPILLLFSLACGGGGGGSEDSDELNKVQVTGTVDFTETSDLNKSSMLRKQEAPSVDEVIFENLTTGENLITGLLSDGSYSLNLAKGTYKITAVSSDNQVFLLYLPNLEEDQDDVNPDIDSTIISISVIANADSTEAFTGSYLETKIAATNIILETADQVLTSSTSTKAERSAALAVLSLKEKVVEINTQGNTSSMQDESKLKTEFVTQDEINKYIASAVQNVISRTSKSVLLPTASDDLVLTSLEEVDEKTSVINAEILVIVDNIASLIEKSNNPPIAKAEDDLLVYFGAPVSLDGSMSFDADGDDLTFLWTQLSGTNVILDEPTTISPNFTAPSQEGTLTFEVIVNDDASSSEPFVITISVLDPLSNLTPVANAGKDQMVNLGETVTLNGDGSYDLDSQNLQYSWRQVSGTSVSLSSSTSSEVNFEAPIVLTTMVFELRVSDGLTSHVDEIIVDTEFTSVALIKPSELEALCGGYPDFSWHTISHALNYRLQISSESDLSNPWFDETVSDNTYSLFTSLDSLNESNNYWSISAIDSNEIEGAQSVISKFGYCTSTAAPTELKASIKEGTKLLVEWERSANPNVDSYTIYYGREQSGSYSHFHIKGDVAEHEILLDELSSDTAGQYYFTVTAYDSILNQVSDDAQELSLVLNSNKRASITLSLGDAMINGGLSNRQAIKLTGNSGDVELTFATESLLEDIVDEINSHVGDSGVVATLGTSSNSILLLSAKYGADEFVEIEDVDGDVDFLSFSENQVKYFSEVSDFGVDWRLDTDAEVLERASITLDLEDTLTDGIANERQALKIYGNRGEETIVFAQAVTSLDYVSEINSNVGLTGVIATFGTSSNSILLLSSKYGSEQFVIIEDIDGNIDFLSESSDPTNKLSKLSAFGKDEN